MPLQDFPDSFCEHMERSQAKRVSTHTELKRARRHIQHLYYAAALLVAALATAAFWIATH